MTTDKHRNEPRVGIIILTWNQRGLTLDCLKSLYKMEYKNWFAIVVDNGSTDSTERAVRDEYPEVKVVVNHSNLGVAGGRNKAIPEALMAGAEWILFLDNDTLVDQAFLGELVKVATVDPHVGGVSPKIYCAEHPNVLDNAGGIFYRILFHARGVGSLEKDNGQYDRASDIDWISGCAGLFRGEVFERVGFLDHDFNPFYGEDVDFCIRVRKAGYRLVLCPSAHVFHRRPIERAHALSDIHNSACKRMLLLRKHANRVERITGLIFLLLHSIVYMPIRARKRQRLSRRYYNGLFKGVLDGLLFDISPERTKGQWS